MRIGDTGCRTAFAGPCAALDTENHCVACTEAAGMVVGKTVGTIGGMPADTADVPVGEIADSTAVSGSVLLGTVAGGHVRGAVAHGAAAGTTAGTAAGPNAGLAGLVAAQSPAVGTVAVAVAHAVQMMPWIVAAHCRKKCLAPKSARQTRN